jgi:hypothetical protein
VPLPPEIWQTQEREAWNDHLHCCASCSDWYLTKKLRRRGVNARSYPCVHLAYYSTTDCRQHRDYPEECPDTIIMYDPRFDEFSVVRRDGDLQVIHNCPWCEAKLRASKRDLWFSTLEKRGFQNPFCSQTIPREFKSDRWWRRRRQGKGTPQRGLPQIVWWSRGQQHVTITKPKFARTMDVIAVKPRRSSAR